MSVLGILKVIGSISAGSGHVAYNIWRRASVQLSGLVALLTSLASFQRGLQGMAQPLSPSLTGPFRGAIGVTKGSWRE